MNPDREARSPSRGCEPPSYGELKELYARVDEAVARLAPVCRISGRCCRFREYSHTLFLSAPEFEYLLSRAPDPVRPLDDGETCPWQDGREKCTAREARPLGCRVYFCDPSYQDAAPEISERFIAELKRLADRHGLGWDYAPLHRHLRGRAGEIIWPTADGPGDTG